MTTALVLGVTGQDGAYLSNVLLQQGYRVYGTSRDIGRRPVARLEALGIGDRVELLQLDPANRSEVRALVEHVRPAEIYGLAGQSSVGASFEDPAGTMSDITAAALNVLETLRTVHPRARYCHASSGEIFGDTGGVPADEETPLRPASPYGVAKAAAHMLVQSYRNSFGLFAANAVLFNHESPLRPDHFVTRKIVKTAARIAAGSEERLRLGRLEVARDWGWAPDYVIALNRMLKQEEAGDYVIATGETVPLWEFVELVFAEFGLAWQDHVDVDESLFRASDPLWTGGNADLASEKLQWRAAIRMPELARRLCTHELALQRGATGAG